MDSDRYQSSLLQSERAVSSAVQPHIEFEEYDLENGMHVILSESHASPLVAINLWYHIGSKDEDPTRTGFAHLFEHMMFQGSENIGKAEHFKYVQNVGGTLNATTNQDRTNYFETLPSSELALGLWLESDRMLALNVTSENFENQRAVVKEERRQRYENQPYGLVYENLLECVFPTSGYHWSTIGSMQHLDETVFTEVQAFHKEFYHPNNCSLAVAGDLKTSEVKSLIEQYFGSIPRGPEIARPVQVIQPLTSQVRRTIYDTVPLTEISLAFQAPPSFSREEAALDILARALGSGRSSRMYKSLVYEKKIAKEISAYNIANELAGMFLISAMVQLSATPEQVEAALWKEIERITTEGITEEELTKVKNKTEAGHVRSLMQLSSRADALQRAYTFTGNTDLANRELELLQSITLEEVREIGKKYLNPEACVVLYCSPKA